MDPHAKSARFANRYLTEGFNPFEGRIRVHAASGIALGPSKSASTLQPFMIASKTKGEPTVPHRPIAGMGRAERYIVTIADRASLDKLCKKLIAAGATRDVLRTSSEKADAWR